MPYIKQNDRDWIGSGIDELVFALKEDHAGNPDGLAGRLNYAITILLSKSYDLTKNPSYAKLNDAIGVLECCKLELYRRLAIPYEDKKIQENGDVY
jgi:hypothetical protein